jgi:hypothetical protein
VARISINRFPINHPIFFPSERFRECKLYVPFVLQKSKQISEFTCIVYDTIVTTDLSDDHKPLKKFELKQKAFEDLGEIEIDEKCPIKVLQFDRKRPGSWQQTCSENSTQIFWFGSQNET